MVHEKITRLLADILDVYEEDIAEGMELTPAFEVEKIHMAKLVIKCEKKFQVTIHDEDVHSFRTIRDMARYIENALAENEGNAGESTEEQRIGWHYQ